jgi:2-polyprenyl-6-methoxyphenol hydroxylase-like FAD-dependent oxidoreductase
VLISGAGIAGPALAYWLLQSGFEPILVERAPEFRVGGYIIDFWGIGFDVAERMDLIPCLKERAYQIEAVRFVNGHGRTVSGFRWDAMQSLLPGRFFSILRGDLSTMIFEKVRDRIDVWFGNSIRTIAQDNSGVRVTMENGKRGRFDLLVGADGLHSGVRKIIFGEEVQFRKHLGYWIASFTAKGYPHRDEGVYVCYNAPRRMVARYALRENQTGFLFVFEKETVPTAALHDPSAQRRLLQEVYEQAGWECPAILEAMHSCDDLYFDAVSQVCMKEWSRGRVALIGDAAFCPSLLAGEGAAFALAGAYLLARELKNAKGDHQSAFRNYELQFRPFIKRKQRAARNLASWFAPTTITGIFLRNQMMKLLSFPLVAGYTFGRMVSDQLDLFGGTDAAR